jgi:hypothetical protein
MPATRSQKAALASPLTTTTRKRSISRALSTEPSTAVVTTTTTTVVKRKQALGDEQEDGGESPKKRARTLKDEIFHEKLQKRVAEKKAAREAEAEALRAQNPYAHLPTYPSPSQRPRSPTYMLPPSLPSNYVPPPIPSDYPPKDYKPLWWTDPTKAKQLAQQRAQQSAPQPAPPATPAQVSAPPQQVAQTQPQPTRGFMGRLLETLTPFRRPSQTPSNIDTRLPAARIDLYQLQEHKKLQDQLNNNLTQAIRMEEQNNVAPPPHHENGEAQEHTQPTIKRKRSATDIFGPPSLNVISESPETRFTDNTQTPSRATATSYTGLVPKSLPKPRRTYKEARAALAQRGTRNAADPPTPLVSRTAPSTPYDKNNYERIRRQHEIEQIRAQQEAMKQKLDKLHAEQEAEAAALPRKTKRVKIEHLKEIPHNLPGEPSGSFRFPEADSDDEMEVDEDVEIIDNAFTTAHDEAPEERQASPTKTSTSNPLTAKPSSILFETPALKATSPIKKALSPVRKESSPVKQAPSLVKNIPSPMKKAPTPMKNIPSPVKEIAEVDETEDGVVDTRDATSSASPEPTQIFSDNESADESDIDDEDWPELPAKKEGESEAPELFEYYALALFNEGFEHFQKTGEVTA